LKFETTFIGSLNTSTVYPLSSKTVFKAKVISGSSSTTRILLGNDGASFVSLSTAVVVVFDS
jgi:hypothetical protein